MKKSSFFAVLCCLCVVLFGFNSCEPSVSMQAVYGIGIHGTNAYGDDFFKFCNYLREKQVPFDGNESLKIFEGSSQADCDTKATKFFNEQAAKLSYEEVTALLQYPDNFYVEYSIVASKKTPDEESRVLGAWIYPKPEQ